MRKVKNKFNPQQQGLITDHDTYFKIKVHKILFLDALIEYSQRPKTERSVFRCRPKPNDQSFGYILFGFWFVRFFYWCSDFGHA